MKINNVELDVCIGDKPVKQYGLDGKTFIEAKNNIEYSLRIKNNNSFRVLVVASVDGLSVMDGESASKEDGGYIVNAYSSFNIKGYRKSMEDVGAFKFSAKEKSYAAGLGKGSNVGVIAFAVFGEKIKQKQDYFDNDFFSKLPLKKYEPYIFGDNGFYPSWTCDSSKAMNESITLCCSSTDFHNKSIQINNVNTTTLRSCSLTAGTTWGQKIEDKVVEAEFEKSSDIPLAMAEIYYDFRESLESLGIKFSIEPKVAFPIGFPRDFAKPPSGWNGA